jgi:hypothetical protein
VREFSVLLNARDGFEVAFEGVDQTASSFSFPLRYVLPHIDVAFARRRQEIPVVSEDEHVEDLLVWVSQVFVLADEAARGTELVYRHILVVLMVVPRNDKLSLCVNLKAFAPLKHFLDGHLV